jgi:hyperosmotically inducible protein
MKGSTFDRAVLCLALATGLLPLAACGRNGEPPAVEAKKDEKGDTHIAIHNEQIKRDLSQAGRELKDNARNLGQQIKESARQIDQSDTAVTARVKARLIAAPDLGGVHIDVNTVDGRVTLTGRVATPDRRADAEKIAARTAGVKSVDNQLTVAPNG